MGREYGYTMIEIIVVLALISIVLAFAIVDLKAFRAPASTGAAELQGFMKKVRARALASTSSYTIRPTSGTHVRATYGTSCSAPTQTADPTLVLDLPTGSNFQATTWSVCYSSRGLSDTSADIIVQDSALSRTVQVVLGGGVRIL